MENTVSCFAGALLDKWSSHSWTEGLQLETVQDMESLTIQTENSTYEVTVICGRTGEILIRGGRFFPEFTAARLAGSSLGASTAPRHGRYRIRRDRDLNVLRPPVSLGAGAVQDGIG